MPKIINRSMTTLERYIDLPLMRLNPRHIDTLDVVTKEFLQACAKEGLLSEHLYSTCVL